MKRQGGIGGEGVSALKVGKRLVDVKQRKIESLTEKKIEVDERIERLSLYIRKLEEDETMNEQVRRGKRATHLANKEEAIDERRSLAFDIDKLKKEVNYFNETLLALRSQEKLPECTGRFTFFVFLNITNSLSLQFLQIYFDNFL